MIQHATDGELIQWVTDEMHYLQRELLAGHLNSCPECKARLVDMEETFRPEFEMSGDAAREEGDLVCLADGGINWHFESWLPDDSRPVTFGALEAEFTGLTDPIGRGAFLVGLMEPLQRLWFRACHAFVHDADPLPCRESLLGAINQLPSGLCDLALLHYEIARTLVLRGRCFDPADSVFARFVSDAVPEALVADIAHELLTDTSRVAELIAGTQRMSVWHGDLLPAAQSEKAAGIVIERHADPEQDCAIVVSVTVELVRCDRGGPGEVVLYPAPAFALWNRDESFHIAEQAAASAASRALGVPGRFEMRWRIDEHPGKLPASVGGGSLALLFEFLLRRIAGGETGRLARVSLSGVALVGCPREDEDRIGRVGNAIFKTFADGFPTERLHTIVMPAHPILHPLIVPSHDNPDILIARKGAVHLLLARTIEHAAELLVVDHETRWQGIDFKLPRMPGPFVGRNVLTARVNEFIHRTDSGYGVLVGGMGVGKTSFLANLVHLLTASGVRPVFHFIPSPGAKSNADYIAKSLYLRLRRKYATAEPPEWSGWQSPRKLEELLKFLSEKYHGSGWKEVLIVDAADQAELPEGKTLVPHILPEELPPGIVCILSSRNNFAHWLGRSSGVRSFFAMHSKINGQDSLTKDNADVGEYLTGLSDEDLPRKLPRSLIDSIVESSVPPVFFTVVKRIGELKDHDTTPERVEKLCADPSLWVQAPGDLIAERYAAILEAVAHRPDGEAQVKRTLGALALAREPLSEAHLQELHLWDDALSAVILREAASFFLPRERPPGAMTLRRAPFRFDHPGFARAICDELGDDGIKSCHRDFAAACAKWRDLEGDGRDYAVQHFTAHLIRARMWPQLYEALTDFKYLQEKLTPRMEPGRAPILPEDEELSPAAPGLSGTSERAMPPPLELAGQRVSRLNRHFELALNREPAFPADDPRSRELHALALEIHNASDVLQRLPQLLVQILHNALAWNRPDIPGLVAKLHAAVPSPACTFLLCTRPPAPEPDQHRRRVCIAHRKAVNCVALGRGVIASGSDDQTVILWSVGSGSMLHLLRGHTGPVRAVAWSSLDLRLVSAANEIRLWDTKTGQCLREFPLPPDITVAAFSPGADRLAVATESGGVSIYDVASGRVECVLRGGGPRVCSLAFSSSRSLLAVGGSDGTAFRGAVEIYDVAARRLLRSLPTGESWANTVAFTDDDRELAAGGGVRRGEVQFFDVESGRQLRKFDIHRSGIRTLALSTDELVTGTHDCSIGFRNIRTGEVIRTGMTHADTVRAVAVSRRGDLIVSASADHSVIIWRVGDPARAGGAPVVSRQPREAHEDTILSSNLAPSGEPAATGGRDGCVGFFGCDSSLSGSRIRIGEDPVNLVAYSPDGTRIAVATRMLVRVLDARTGEERLVLRGHANWILRAAWFDDGNGLLTVDEGGFAFVWDARTGQRRRTFEAHTAPLRAVAMSPDGIHVATAGDDTKILIWNVNTGEIVNTLRGHTRWIYALAFCPKTGRLASAGSDESIRIWNPLGKEIRKLDTSARQTWALKFSTTGLLAAGGTDRLVRVFAPDRDEPFAWYHCRDAAQDLWFNEPATELRIVDRGGAELIPNIYVTEFVPPVRL
ncbi:MAG: WD40 repeat domain-containing protein [Chthoniobacteraceae bacterium]